MTPLASVETPFKERSEARSLLEFNVRFFLTVAVLAGELVGITVAVDAQPLLQATGLTHFIGITAHWGLYTVILGFGLALALAWPSIRRVLRTAPADLSWRIVFPQAAIFHSCAYGLFCAASILLCQATPNTGRNWLAALTIASGAGTFLSAFLVLIPASFWYQLGKAAPLAPVYGFAGSVAAITLFNATQSFIGLWMHWTFKFTYWGLRLVQHDVVADPALFILGTKSFSVEVAPACAGYEGVALMLAFGSAWLLFFRRDFRFPQALLLIPVGMFGIWILNCVRLVALLLIGNAGAPEIALKGFHSQAGWIAFLGMAIIFSTVSQRLPGIAKVSRGISIATVETEQTSAFLLPFLVILAVGMLAQAVSGGFEWFYPLRVLGAASVLWWYRRSYAEQSWRPGRLAIAIGILIFFFWIGSGGLFGPTGPAAPIPAALAGAPMITRVSWILFRVLGAVITVPIAEELAFRGYLLRRLVSADFASVSPRQFTVLSFAVSSILFGVLHGQRWIAGTLAGLLYAWAYQRRGRIGDAVAAHAVTNGLLAAWVLFTGNWSYW